MPKIYDNIENFLTTGLNETLGLSRRTDFCVGYFNLRGWKQVVDKIDALPGDMVVESQDSFHRTCRLLVGMQRLPVDTLRDSFIKGDDLFIDQAEAAKLKRKVAEEFKEQLTIGTPSADDEKALQRLGHQMKDGKVVVKLFLKHRLHAKLYLAYSQDPRVPIVGFLGSSNLTLPGLSKQGELNIDVMDQDASKKLANWFEDRWNDRWCLDITKELIEIIDSSWATEHLVPPYHIYLKVAYHLSREARAGISEFKLSKIFQKELLEFQQKAVLIAAHHLHRRGGVMIGDVVGLGKTITATALAKLFEEDFFLETLILCPKNLVEMWEGYVHKYGLKAKIISQSKVQKRLSKERRYRLVIIDESHNMRNSQGSRYKAIKDYIQENECKVILLTATPYNKSFLDLSNQLKLFISSDKDLGILPENYISHLGGQVQFVSKHTDIFIRSIRAFEKSDYTDDWKELMRLYLVRRTRSFIRDRYAKLDESNGRRYLTFSDQSKFYFPDRIPKRVEYEFDPNDPTDQYARLYSSQIVDIINALELPRYGLGNYLFPRPILRPSESEKIILDNLSRAGKRLMGFCRTNLFKRLESSGYAFLLSIGRHVLRNFVFVYAIENKLPLPIGKNVTHNLDDFIEDDDTDNEGKVENHLRVLLDEDIYLEKAEELYHLFSEGKTRKHFDWVNSDFFRPELLEYLVQDARELIRILEIANGWDPDKDRQLLALYQLLTIKHENEKVLVFTQFADTARYLRDQLVRMGIEKLDCVAGDNENPTSFAHRFSPQSNDKPELVNSTSELRVLIATDVLSEGQNLQDAHIILNFDLPWALIRLIQRAGRVDRIGQKATEIICYSFLPEDGLDAIISLRNRLARRIQQNAEVVGADETFFEGDPINLTDLYSEHSGLLDDAENDNEVDLASLAYQIWKEAIEDDPSLQKLIPDMPNVVYGTKENSNEPSQSGVILYARTAEDNDALAWLSTKGEIITQSQHTILKALQCSPTTPALSRLNDHHELVRKGVEHITLEETHLGGTLGKTTGARYKTYMLLDRYCKINEGTFFVTDELKKAVDEIYKYPLREFAKDSLNRQIKSGISDDDLARMVVSLREEDKLVISPDGELEVKLPQIICSMGLKNI